MDTRAGLGLVTMCLLAGALATTGEEKAVEDEKNTTKIETNKTAISEDQRLVVHSNVSTDTNYLNTTHFNSSLHKEVNVSEEFHNNSSLERLDSESGSFDFDEYFTESMTTEYFDPKRFERRSDNGDEYFNGDEVKERKSSPKLDKEMVEMAFKGDQTNKIQNLLNEQYDQKKIQRRTFDIMGMFGFKNNNKYDTVVKITKEIAVPVPYTVEKKIPVPVKVEIENPIPVPVPKSYPVTVEKKVYYPVKEYIHAPYPVYKKIPYLVKVAVENPVPVHIEKPYPVYIEKKVPYPIEKQIHYPVKIPVDRPIPVQIPVVKNVYYPVEKKVIYPVSVPVEKPYPVYVEKEVPIPVETHDTHTTSVEEHNIPYDVSNHNYEKGEPKDHSFIPSEEIKLDLQNKKTEGGFVPLVPIVQGHVTTQLQDKRDDNITVEEPRSSVNTTEKPILLSGNKKNHEDKKEEEKDFQEFGKKIKKP